MTEPHASWADIYDLVYEESFGEFYNALTDTTVEQIRETIDPQARIVDFGAGTGRLSIPLASSGYAVVAVEPCREMPDQLHKKSGSEAVSCFIGKMQDFHTDKPFDMAICVFTVILYLLEENSLKNSFDAAYKALCPGGYMLLDIPPRGIFNSFRRKTKLIQRNVTVKPVHDDIYSYEENTTLDRGGSRTLYTDRFEIRYWDVEKVLQVLSNAGFSIIDGLSMDFAGTGSQYFLAQK